MVEARAAELRRRPVKPTFDLAHLRAIHRHLFQDVYDWAGELRRVNLNKPGDPVGFFPYQRFDIGAPAVFEGIAGRGFQPGMERERFLRALTRTGQPASPSPGRRAAARDSDQCRDSR